MSVNDERGNRIARLLNPGLIAVVRALRTDQVVPMAEALVAGGIIAIEITTTTPNHLDAIRQARERMGDRALVGVGTLLDVPGATAALAAGAEFVVSPVGATELIELAHAAGCPIMLGAYTATECLRVHAAGADFVKLFPADTLGPGYVKALRAPLPDLRIVPTGGVDLATASQWLEAGCVALGVGSSLLKPDILKSDDWESEIQPIVRSLARHKVNRVDWPKIFIGPVNATHIALSPDDNRRTFDKRNVMSPDDSAGAINRKRTVHSRVFS